MNAPEQKPTAFTPRQWTTIALILVPAIGSVVYSILAHQNLTQTAALFIGIPTLLAILLALSPKAGTATGGIIKGMTIFLLICAPILREGFLCILFAAPLFYLVGVFVGVVVDHFNRKRPQTLSCLTLLMLPMCFEGVVPQLTRSRHETVSVTRVVNASSDEVANAISHSPRIDTPLPPLLRIGFQRPLWFQGEGLSIGATRTIHFSGSEGHPPGDLIMRVAADQPGYARFATVSNDTKVAHWLNLTGSEVRWTPIDASHTTVTWQIHFDRLLDPAWYFAPAERLFVRNAAAYLIEANAIPAER
jgi:hypothetical protein